MDLAITAGECLYKIFELREAIRHQRSANSKMYLRLTEIFAELKMFKADEDIQDNTLQSRNTTFKRFERAVIEFANYLEKYDGMGRVKRLFKLSTMQEEHQKVLDEINQLYQMLGLLTYKTLVDMKGSAEKREAKFLKQLGKIHKDVKLTHDQVEAFLSKLVEKRTAERKAKEQPEMNREKAHVSNEPEPEPIADADQNEVEVLVSPKSEVCPIDIDNTEVKFRVLVVYREPVVEPEPQPNAEEETKVFVWMETEDLESNDGTMNSDNSVEEPINIVIQTSQDNMSEENLTLESELDGSPLSDNTSVVELMDTLKSCQVDDHDTELTLLRLIRLCTTSINRLQVYKTEGVPTLTRFIRESKNPFTQMYALHCLGWFTFSYSKMRVDNFEKLRKLVRAAPPRETVQLLHDLERGDEKEREIAVIRSCCMATRGDADTLRRGGVLPPLVGLLTYGSDNQKLWAVEALETLASNSGQTCVKIEHEGAIGALVTLLRDGSDLHKQEAAYALGNLAADNDLNRRKIVQEGAIPHLVAFMNAVTDAQNQWAVYALGCLSLNNEGNRIKIGEEDIIRSLVRLVRVGSMAQKQWAAFTLGNLSLHDSTRRKIITEGAIKPLVALLETGTDAQHRWAAYALGNLSSDNNDARTTMELTEAVLPLVKLVRTGSDQYTHTAAYTLGQLAANNDDICAKIALEGAIPALVELLRSTIDEQQKSAAYALGRLAVNEATRQVIIESEAVEVLTVLIQTGREDLKSQAESTLKILSVGGKKDSLLDKIMRPTLEFVIDGVNSQNVAAALSTVGEVVPFFQRLMKPLQKVQPTPLETPVIDVSADPKDLQHRADAW